MIPWGREDILDRDRLLYVDNRREWRAWLKAHYRSEKEVWLVFYKKHTGKTRIPYNDAVEEALCFGWIDSTVRRVDEDSYAQRFTPRRPNSSYSQANLERLRVLASQGKVAKEVLAALGDLPVEDFVVPPDILASLKASSEAWKNFQGFSPSYKRIRIAYIEGARRRPEEFQRRLRNFVRMTEKNKQIGYGGIEKYY